MEVSVLNLLLDLVEKMCVVIVVTYLVTRSRFFTEILDKRFNLKNRLFLILVFGLFSIVGTYSGLKLFFGAIANVRDLGPMMAGLIGGPVVGLGAGLIGGVHRYFLGGLTYESSAMATVIAGLAGGLIYTWRKGAFVDLWRASLFVFLMESFRFGLALLISRPFADVVELLKLISLPMTMANLAGMAIFVVMTNNVIEERRTAGERDRLRRDAERRAYEMELAQSIQKSFLPETTPDLDGFQLAALNVPALEVGGDFYDFIPISADTWGLVIADVSGKGVPAALFMTVSRTLVRANALGNCTAAKVIQRVNDLISEDDRSNMFVTLFYSILDVRRRTLKYVNAGHNAPLLLTGEGRDVLMLQERGVALGLMPDVTFEEKEIALGKDAVVVFYTDGVTEAVNNRQEQFGKERLVKVLEESHHLSAQEIMNNIRQELADFTGDQAQFDDITMIVLKSLRDGHEGSYL